MSSVARSTRTADRASLAAWRSGGLSGAQGALPVAEAAARQARHCAAARFAIECLWWRAESGKRAGSIARGRLVVRFGVILHVPADDPAALQAEPCSERAVAIDDLPPRV